MAKLTSYDKATIREWYHTQDYTQSELAEIYGVGRSTIQRVLSEPDFVPEIYDGHSAHDDGQMDWVDGQENAQQSEPVGIDAHDDGPPPWFGWVLLALAMGGAAFVGWKLYHAI